MKKYPPVPELLFRGTAPNPTFVFILGLNMELVDEKDYVFAYNDNLQCFGSNAVKGNQGILPIMGNDNYEPEVQGFEYNEKINLGYYDFQTDTFYKLEGEVVDYMTKKEVDDPTWAPMNIFMVNNPRLGDIISLQRIESISTAKLEISGSGLLDLNAKPEIGKPRYEEYLFKVEESFLESMQLVTANGKGTIEKTKAWVDGQGWMTHKYIPTETDSNVIINAVGFSLYDKQFLTAQHTFEVIQKEIIVEPPPPTPEEPDIIYKDTKERFELFIKTYNNKIFSEIDMLGVNTLTDLDVLLQVKVTYDNGKVNYQNLDSKGAKSGSGAINLDGVKSITFFKGYFDGNGIRGKKEYMTRETIIIPHE